MEFEVLVTGDDQLAAEALRLAGAAGVPLRRFQTLLEAAPYLGPTRLMLVGADLGVHAVADLGPSLAGGPVRLAFGSQIETGARPAGDPTAVASDRQVGSIPTLYLPGDADRLLRLLEMGGSAGARCTLGVLGARGGIGVSVLTAAIARQMASRGGPTTLVDLDMAGGGLDVLLGLENEAGQRWPNLLDQTRQIGLDLPSWQGVRVLSAGRSSGEPADLSSVHRVIRRLAGQGTTVLDIGRGAGGIDPVRAACWCQSVIVVASIDTVAIAGAGVLLRRLADCGLDVRLVTCEPSPAALSPAQVAEVLSWPVSTHLRHQRGLAVGLEHGGAPGDGRRSPVASAARHLVQELWAPKGGARWPN